MSVTIWRPGDALERCSVCGNQRQFHDRAPEPHDLVPETLADYEPCDLSPEQLVSEINRIGYPSDMRLTGWPATDVIVSRSNECRTELRNRVQSMLGVDFQDLQEALA